MVTKLIRSYRNGRRRPHPAIINAPAPRGAKPRSRGPGAAGPRLLNLHCRPHTDRAATSSGARFASAAGHAGPSFQFKCSREIGPRRALESRPGQHAHGAGRQERDLKRGHF